MSYTKITTSFKDHETVLTAAHLQHLENGIADNDAALVNRVRTDTNAQGLGTSQKRNARANIDAPSTAEMTAAVAAEADLRNAADTALETKTDDIQDEVDHAKEDIGWPLKLTEPLSVDNGGTGATTAANAIANLGGVKKTGDTMTGNLNVQGYTYPSIKIKPTYESKKMAAAVVEGNFNGIAALEACEDENGNVRRQLEVRTESFQPGLDYAVLLRTNNNGTWGTYRLFHTGMSSPVPVTCGGTGSTTETGARANLGLTDASNLSTGTVAMARLPFKIAYGSGKVSGNSALQIDYSSAGFTQVPYVCASYSTTGSNWSGDNGALKISSKNTAGAAIIVGGSFNNLRDIDWIAIGI